MKTLDKYILVGKDAGPCSDLLKWALWFETANRRVAETFVGSVRVSTVFLGLDYRFSNPHSESPILFETMVFGGPHDGDKERYCSWEEAEEGHEQMVERIKREEE
jgi:hypothetical protein